MLATGRLGAVHGACRQVIDAGVSARNYTRNIVVQVWVDGQFRGAGFFYARGIVVTCAHVVPDGLDGVQVRWQGQSFAARVVARDPDQPGESAYYGFPDLAFVRLASPPFHPTAVVSRLVDPGRAGPIQAFGFSTETPEPGVAEHVAKLEVAGPSGRYYRLKDDEIVAGMSGAPAVDSGNGTLYGVVKATRDYQDDRGGWVTPTADLLDSAARFAAELGGSDAEPPPVFPAPGSAMYRLLEAQRAAAEVLPYQLVGGRMPRVSQVYVDQRAAGRRSRLGLDTEAVEAGDSIPVAAMLAKHQHALVVGGPGSGKSTLAQHIVLETAHWWLSAGESHREPPYGRCVAVRASARDLLQGKPWLDSLAAAVGRQAGDFLDSALDPSTFADPPLPHAEWMVLVDGLDEIIDGHQRAKFIQALAYHLAEYGRSIRFLITTRNLPEPELERLRLQLFPPVAAAVYGEYTLRPFDHAALREFAGNWFLAAADSVPAARVDEFLQRANESRITELIHVPLLATIALTVFERDPASPLPLDRAGLYGRFVLGLLYERRARIDARAAVLAQLRRHGQSAEQVGEFIYDRTEGCLEWIAQVRLRNEVALTIDTAMEWLEGQLGTRPELPGLAGRLRDLLISTGLLFVRSDESLEFVHHTFAEYFAAGWLARQGFDSRRWLWAARRNGLNNIALVTFARWVHAGHDPLPVMRRLFRFGWAVGYRNLDIIAAMLYDGLPTDAGANRQLVALAHRYLCRARIGEEHRNSLRSILPALRRRDETGAMLRRLISAERASGAVRVEACCVLLDVGDGDERAAGAGQLNLLAFAPGQPTMDRQWSLYRVAEVGDPAARDHAVRRLAGTVLSTTDSAVLGYAVSLLARLGLHREAEMALLLRAVWRWHDLPTRVAALNLFWVVGYDAPADAELDALRQARHVSFPEAEGQPEMVHHLGLALAAEVVRCHSGSPVAEAALDHALRDPAMSWSARLTAAKQMLERVPEAAATNEVVRRLLDDRTAPPAGLVRLAEIMMFCEIHRPAGFATLQAYAADGGAPTTLRIAAARAMFRCGAEDAAARQAAEWVGDERLSRRARCRAALLLAMEFDEYELAIARLSGARPLLLRGVRRLLCYQGGLLPVEAVAEERMRVSDDRTG